jgi:hypothetical protein
LLSIAASSSPRGARTLGHAQRVEPEVGILGTVVVGVIVLVVLVAVPVIVLIIAVPVIVLVTVGVIVLVTVGVIVLVTVCRDHPRHRGRDRLVVAVPVVVTERDGVELVRQREDVAALLLHRVQDGDQVLLEHEPVRDDEIGLAQHPTIAG